MQQLPLFGGDATICWAESRAMWLSLTKSFWFTIHSSFLETIDHHFLQTETLSEWQVIIFYKEYNDQKRYYYCYCYYLLVRTRYSFCCYCLTLKDIIKVNILIRIPSADNQRHTKCLRQRKSSEKIEIFVQKVTMAIKRATFMKLKADSS